MQTQCPSCDSTDVISHTLEKYAEAPHGEAVKYLDIENECLNCGFKGDFLHQNDKTIETAWKQSLVVSVGRMLGELLGGNISQTYFEMALRLSPKTVTRWKRGGMNSSAMALLRIVHAYPWILDVSDKNFDPFYANKSLLSAAPGAFSFLAEYANKKCYDDEGFARIARGLEKDWNDLEITDMCYFSDKGEIYYFSDGIAAVRLYDALDGSEDPDAWLLLGPDGQPAADITQPEANNAYTWHYYQLIEDFQNNPDKDMIRDYPSEEDMAQFDIATDIVDGDEDIYEDQKLKPKQDSLPPL